jgi:hypothetical protein
MTNRGRVDAPQSMRRVWEHDLTRVATLREVARRFHKHPKSVLMAILTERLIADKRDSEPGQKAGVWLISVRSAEALWGPALEGDEEYVES